MDVTFLRERKYILMHMSHYRATKGEQKYNLFAYILYVSESSPLYHFICKI
jgi:hypothetical protein